MDFYFYLCLRPRKVTIHRGECPFCRQGKGIQRKIFKDALGFWRGPYPDYQTAFAQATIDANPLCVVPAACKHCQHAGRAHALTLTSKESCPLNRRETDKPASTYEMNRLLSLTKLEKRHSTEREELTNFYTSLYQLMQTRHQSEQKLAGLDLVSINQQHIRQVEELAQAQQSSYQALVEKQAQEMVTLLNKLSPLIAGN